MVGAWRDSRFGDRHHGEAEGIGGGVVTWVCLAIVLAGIAAWARYEGFL
jgi:hypothetical protein